MNFKELFVARPANGEGTEWMITFGKHLATQQTFVSKKAAEYQINKTNWDLVACIAAAIVRAEEIKAEEESKEVGGEA